MTEAIERSRRLGAISILARIVETPGYRRQLADRFDAWTRDERSIDGPPPIDSPGVIEEWAIYRSYRETLAQVGAEDPAGWSVWASRRLAKQPPSELRKPAQVIAIDPVNPSRAGWRLLDHCHQHARSMTVSLPFDADPALAELYATVDDTRRQFLGWGFVEEFPGQDLLSVRPRGLAAVEAELFRSDAHERPPLQLEAEQGLRILGGPRGEGVGLLIAREVQRQRDRGVHPEEILILVPRLDDDSDRIRESLVAWDLPAFVEAPGRLATIPALSALRLAMRLAVDGWESGTLVQLLRNGQVGRSDLDGGRRFGRFEAASAIHSTRVFRDRRALEEVLERDQEDPARGRSASSGLRALLELGDLIDSTTGPGSWPIQVGRLRAMAGRLELDEPALGPLFDALDDRGWVLEALGPAIAAESLTWAGFVGQVESIIADGDAPARAPEPGMIRIASVREAEGARARVVILANLAEASFPSRDSIDLDVDFGESSDRGVPAPASYSREMLRFARVAGSADEQLVLAYPTSDLNGEVLLPAGFLDDLIRRLDESSSTCLEKHARFDPVLLDHPDLARSPADLAVRAVALSSRSKDDGPLRHLAANPRNASTLLGTADAFEVAHRRRVEREFGPYDGRLRDPAAIGRIRDTFGPAHAFSATQLESFALCPFQFFQRYVLGLKKVDDRLELDEDYAGRGSDVHRVLEEIHQQALAEGDGHIIDRLGVLIETRMQVDLERHEQRPSSVPQVLEEIGDRRTAKALARYANQFRAYAGGNEVEPRPYRFEVAFGQEGQDGSPDSLAHLALGDPANEVRLQGKIDRIDVVFQKGKAAFRVIDYKTGSNPSGKDVETGLASQLPLYALAVERLIFPSGDHEFADAGYWSLPKEGYKPVKIGEWTAYRGRLMTFVVDLVARLREGDFPIESRKKDCRKFCDYHAACRVGEVRLNGKVWASRPILGEVE